MDYINAMLPAGLKVTENEPIVVKMPGFFDALGRLLRETPRRVIANYLLWRIVDFSTAYMTEKIRRRHQFYKIVRDDKFEIVPRWKECVQVTNKR